MPAQFASSYTPFHEAGSEEQRKRLARMMAILLTKEGEGPGVQFIKSERQKLYMERQAAKSEGTISIPPTSAINQREAQKKSETKDEKYTQPQVSEI